MDVSPSIYLSGILALGIAAQWLAWRLHLPAIVLLLAFGFGLGQFASPDQIIEENLLFAIVSISVAIILFEGGLTLRIGEISETRGVVFRLVTAGLLVTWCLTAVAARRLLGLDPSMAILAGALFTVSGPTVIIPLLRHVRPARRIGSLVKWEGIVNDPIGAVLAALVFEYILHGSQRGSPGATFANLIATLAVGAILGLATGGMLTWLLKRYWIPDFLQNAVFLATVVAVFTASNLMMHEAGLVTVTVLGVFLANQQSVTVNHVIEFKENLRVLLISLLFILLSSRIQFQDMLKIGWRGFAFLATLILIVRPLSVLIATAGSELQMSERWFLAWIHPRGIVAAAVASLFALQIEALEKASPGRFSPAVVENAQQLVPLTFLVIVGSVTIYGLTLAPLGRRLGLTRQNPQGVLFAGAAPFVRAIATSLAEANYQVLLVDTNHSNISTARMAGLPVCLASIGSEYVREEIDLGDIGRLLAMTPNDQVNALATLEFAEHFSRAEVYQLAPNAASNERQESIVAHRRGRQLFGTDVTYQRLASRFSHGAQIKRTRLSEDFTYEDFRHLYGHSAIILFLLEESGKLIVCTSETEVAPKPGQTLISLVDPVVETAKESVRGA